MERRGRATARPATAPGARAGGLGGGLDSKAATKARASTMLSSIGAVGPSAVAASGVDAVPVEDAAVRCAACSASETRVMMHVSGIHEDRVVGDELVIGDHAFGPQIVEHA